MGLLNVQPNFAEVARQGLAVPCGTSAPVPQAATKLSSPEAAFWLSLAAVSLESARALVTQRYEPWVRMVAAQLYRHRTSTDICFDDYLQFGLLGMFDAMTQFDASRNVPFAKFSERRIR